MEQSKSFYNIISDYIIEVPIIQREYAQGRNTEKVKSIRKRFVNDLVDAIKTKEEIHLGFIYGKVQGRENIKRKILNKEAVSSILDAVKFYASNLELHINANIEETESERNNQNILKFIPLDGQQRLTTLYLLHWYLYFKGAKNQNKDWLNHFKYANRKSSLAFCKELVNDKNIEILKRKQENNNAVKINELITNANFYLKKWNKDATVRGMLEMLSSIENAFDPDFDFLGIEIENLPFTFDFMDLDSLNQTDELYVKMNSRGKQLSDYEHFKSWLQEKHKDTEEQEWLKSFLVKLDTEWLNYFWRNIDADFNALDDFYYNYIKNLALMYTIANNNGIPFEKLKYLYGVIRNTEVYNNKEISYIPLESYTLKYNEDGEDQDYFIFNIDALKFIEKTFDSLCYLEQGDNFENLKLEQIVCKPFVENKLTDFFLKSNLFTPTLWHSVFLYSFIIFINDREEKEFTLNGLHKWLRFTRNIIYNTYIQNPENLNSALTQINKIGAFKFQIHDAILNGKIENIFFERSQYEEEKTKIQLVSLDGWKDAIVPLENHSYLYGQINFILNFSKDTKGNFSLQDFTKYGNAVSKLYSEEIRLTDDKILERFLLCEGFYLPYYKSNHIFCNGSLGGLRTKNENWRLFFKSDKINYLKQAIDNIYGTEITPEQLSDFIDIYLKSNSFGKSNWKYLFLKYHKAISYCKESAIRKESENDIRLLKGFPIRAFHTELRSYCFYLAHKNHNATSDNKISPAKFLPFKKFLYFEERYTQGHPGVYLEEFTFKDKGYRLDIRYSKDKDEFKLCFFHNVEINDRSSDITLERLNFNFESQFNHYFKSIPYDKIENELKDICCELKHLAND